MIDAINKIEDRILFFVIIVMMVAFDAFTKQTSMTELAKMIMPAYAGYMAGRATGVLQIKGGK